MLLYISFLSLLVNVASSEFNNGFRINRLLEIIKRRESDLNQIIDVPKKPKDLPKTEAILPGHTLQKPSVDIKQSAAKYPHKNMEGAVYGNIQNLGITYGKTAHRVLYTGFRRDSKLLDHVLLHAIKNIIKNNKSKDKVILIRSSPASNNVVIVSPENHNGPIKSSKEENDASEIFDISASDQNENALIRRSSHKGIRKTKFRNRDYSSASMSDSDDSPSSEDFQKNEGNPFTLHKGKYKQNWMWNHALDGDHMNINPYGPNFLTYGQDGPTGEALFLGRKWWYFHEKDFKPLR
ncbi:hypothetical protein ACJJTC_007004 [Scirpophaga incertulas]